MIDYGSARAVAMVVQTGSFERAAKALNVTPSAISQRVRQLEERLGVVLIERGTPCIATERGAWLCRHMEHVGMLEQDLIEHLPGLVDPAAPVQRVTLNVATNADSLGTWFLTAISAFAQSTAYLLSVAIDDEGHTAAWLQRGRVVAAVSELSKAFALAVPADEARALTDDVAFFQAVAAVVRPGSAGSSANLVRVKTKVSVVVPSGRRGAIWASSETSAASSGFRAAIRAAFCCN